MRTPSSARVRLLSARAGRVLTSPRRQEGAQRDTTRESSRAAERESKCSELKSDQSDF